jgi:hypothetical protein
MRPDRPRPTASRDRRDRASPGPNNRAWAAVTLDPTCSSNVTALTRLVAAQRANEMRTKGDGKGEAIRKAILEAALDLLG